MHRDEGTLRLVQADATRDVTGGGRGLPLLLQQVGRMVHVPEGASWLPASRGAGLPSGGGRSVATQAHGEGGRLVVCEAGLTVQGGGHCLAAQTAGLPREHLETTAQRERHGRQRSG